MKNASVVNTPVTFDVPQTVTVDVPKQIVIDRNTVLIVAAAGLALYVGSKAIKKQLLKRQIRAGLEEMGRRGSD